MSSHVRFLTGLVQSVMSLHIALSQVAYSHTFEVWRVRPTWWVFQVICNKGMRNQQRFVSKAVTAASSPTWDFSIEVPLIKVEDLPQIHIRVMKSRLITSEQGIAQLTLESAGSGVQARLNATWCYGENYEFRSSLGPKDWSSTDVRRTEIWLYEGFCSAWSKKP